MQMSCFVCILFCWSVNEMSPRTKSFWICCNSMVHLCNCHPVNNLWNLIMYVLLHLSTSKFLYTVNDLMSTLSLIIAPLQRVPLQKVRFSKMFFELIETSKYKSNWAVWFHGTNCQPQTLQLNFMLNKTVQAITLL